MAIKGTMEQVGVQLSERYEVRIDPDHEEEWNKDRMDSCGGS